MKARASKRIYDGRVISMRVDDVEMPDGAIIAREVIEHPGAVGVVALDDAGRILLVEQYRHPVGQRLIELPAGLLDMAGESGLQAAKRELAEEGQLAASTWDVLADVLPSPGGSNEAFRVFLARSLSPSTAAATEGFVAEHEESTMTTQWVDLSEAVTWVCQGRIRNGMACVGILAAHLARSRGWSGLRPAESAWPDRSHPVLCPEDLA